MMSELSKLIDHGTMDEFEKDEFLEESRTQFYKSDFNFLNEHNGWRPGKQHLILAPTHAGKSTLTRSIAWDFVNNNELEKVLVWLSEESKAEFKSELAKIGLPKEKASRIIIASEQDGDLSLSEKKMLFAESLKLANPQLLLFDNITTSSFYAGRKVDEQERFASYLKTTGKSEDIAMAIIAHTGGESQMNKRLLELNDIRGGKDIVNLAEFAYILQMIKVYDEVTQKTKKFPIIRIEKHRGQAQVENFLFHLRYNPTTVSFMEDRPKCWNEFKELFKKQMSL